MPIPADALARILPTVRKPGRYIGGEYNTAFYHQYKDWQAVALRVCLAFPDLYDLGMSNLGLAILYDILNGLPDVLAERTYLPWVDMIAALRRAGLPLYSLESKRPLAEFDWIGVTLPYEQLYTNLLELLDLAGLPILAAERDERHPLILAGGHATFNPEPVADFVDLFVIGDGEEVILDLVRTYQQVRTATREEQLRALARIPGVYVPRFYDVRYHADGTVAAIEPRIPEAAFPVKKRVVPILPPPPTRLLVPNVDISHNRAAVEIQRGCTRGCRFCHAGMVTRPVRERPPEEVLTAIEAIVSQTGFEEVGLLSLSSSDYSQIGALVTEIAQRFADQHLAISLPALRADSFSLSLAEALSRSPGRHTGFTFAPEAAAERLRRVINKQISTDQMLAVAREVFKRGTRTIKLYFMIGLPSEEMEDVMAIANLARAVWREGRAIHRRKAQVNVSVNIFIPKPHTPFQWVGLESSNVLQEKQALLRQALHGRGIKLNDSDLDMACLEATLSRGDRRLGSVIRRAWELGARFDAWDEQRNMEAWQQAFEESGLEWAFYIHRFRSPDEILPWDVVSTGVHRGFLWREYQRSQEAALLNDCRAGCHACGILHTYGEMYSAEWGCPSPKT